MYKQTNMCMFQLFVHTMHELCRSFPLHCDRVCERSTSPGIQGRVRLITADTSLKINCVVYSEASVEVSTIPELHHSISCHHSAQGVWVAGINTSCCPCHTRTHTYVFVYASSGLCAYAKFLKRWERKH